MTPATSAQLATAPRIGGAAPTHAPSPPRQPRSSLKRTVMCIQGPEPAPQLSSELFPPLTQASKAAGAKQSAWGGSVCSAAPTPATDLQADPNCGHCARRG